MKWKRVTVFWTTVYSTHLTLGMLLHYLGKLKIQIFCRYPADMEENASKLHFRCTDFNSFMCVTVYAECILSSSLNTMLIVDRHCSDVCCDEFPMTQTDCKSKQLKEPWLGKFYLQLVWGKTRYFKYRNYHNLWMYNKVRGDKMQFVCLFFHICWISAENLNF